MTTKNPSHHPSNRWTSGAALILIGLLLLAGQLFDLPSFGQLFMPALGLVFLVWGIFTRNAGLLIPGGILSGIGVGVYLMQTLSLEGDGHPGIFMISFGAGFGLITLLSVLFTSEKQWWALIPGAIMALIGAGLLIGGAALDVLSFLGTYWPIGLILAGLFVIFKRK